MAERKFEYVVEDTQKADWSAEDIAVLKRCRAESLLLALTQLSWEEMQNLAHLFNANIEKRERGATCQNVRWAVHRKEETAEDLLLAAESLWNRYGS